MRGYLRIVVLFLGTIALVGVMHVLQGQAQAPAGGQAPAQARPVFHPDPSTQTPEHLVTPEQMKKWEKELSNWGRWGKDDEKGTLNLITPEKTKEASKLMRDGRPFSLYRFPDIGRGVDYGNFAETVHWMTSVPGGALLAPRPGEARPQPTGALDAISLAMHEGPHMDALCHYALRDSRGPDAVIYNGYKQNLSEKGCPKAGIDKMGSSYITRAVLYDFPLLKGKEWLEGSTALYVSDLEAWEKFAGVKVGRGDVIIIRTGRWARREKTGPWNTGPQTPGLHASVLPWLHQRDVALIVADVATDVIPSGVKNAAGTGDWGRPIHDITLPVLGTTQIDNGYTENVAKEAARQKRWEFMIMWNILPVTGGTASPFLASGWF